MLTKDKEERKTIPLYRGLFQYFPAALAEVAHVSHVGNEQHNPGEDCFDNREKSNDDYDCMLRHMVEADEDDDDGLLHAAKVAWRALRACQKILESRGAMVAPAARWPAEAPVFIPNGFEVLPSLERIPGMDHREYYQFDPDEAIYVCAALNCWSTIKSSDTPIFQGGRPYCSWICASGHDKAHSLVGYYVRDTSDNWEGELLGIQSDGLARVRWWKQNNGYVDADRRNTGLCHYDNLTLCRKPVGL